MSVYRNELLDNSHHTCLERLDSLMKSTRFNPMFLVCAKEPEGTFRAGYCSYIYTGLQACCHAAAIGRFIQPETASKPLHPGCLENLTLLLATNVYGDLPVADDMTDADVTRQIDGYLVRSNVISLLIPFDTEINGAQVCCPVSAYIAALAFYASCSKKL